MKEEIKKLRSNKMKESKKERKKGRKGDNKPKHSEP